MKNKAQNAIILSGVLGLVVVATMLYVGNIILSKINTSLADTLPSSSTTAKATMNNISSNVNSSMQLSAVSPIILGATLILGIILAFAAVVGRS